MSGNHNTDYRNVTSLRSLILLALLLSFTSMFNNISLPNERSRLYMVIAQVDHGTFSIDKPLRKHGRIGDRAKFGGKYYSDKAPGSALLGGFVYRMVRTVTSADDWNVASLLRLMRRAISIPFALLGFVWLRRLLHTLGISTIGIEWASWSWMLGSTAFHYGGAFFGHQIAAALIVGAGLYLHLGILTGSKVNLLFAGFLGGAAVVTEYPAGIAVIALSLYGLLHLPALKVRWLLWVLGGLPMALLLGYYHHTCFGDPFSLPYEHLAAATYRKIHGTGLAGVTGPELEGLHLWFTSLRRGLLSTSPIYLFSLIGIVPTWKTDWRLGFALSFFAISLILFVSGAHIWGGDWGYGPRIMVFGLGLMTIPLSFFISASASRPKWLALVALLMLFSIVSNQYQHFFFPEPWSKSLNPIIDTALPMMHANLCAPNLLTLHLGWSMTQSALALAGVLSLHSLWLLHFSTAHHPGRLFLLLTLGIFGLFWLLMASGEADPAIQEDWIKLVNLWQSREAGYH